MSLITPRRIIDFVLVIIIAGVTYYYWGDIGRVWRQFHVQVLPCRTAIAYSFGPLDPRFNLPVDKLIPIVAEAEAIWESRVNKPLFKYSPDGDLKINFIYDNRQKATQDLKNIDVALTSDRAGYEALRVKRDELLKTYNAQKQKLNLLVSAYERDKTALETTIKSWNAKGGAPKQVYTDLENQRDALNAKASEINNERDKLNEMVDSINAVSNSLNNLSNSLNLKVDKYNTVSKSNGEVFSEGTYSSDASGTRIDIFQFDDEKQLVRLLAHELGHALGIDHVSDPNAVMYYLNESTNGGLTNDDLNALRDVCGIK